MGVVVRLDGEDITEMVAGFRTEANVNAVGVCVATVIDPSSTYRPHVFEPLTIDVDGTRVFSGTVAHIGMGTEAADRVRVIRIAARDANALAQRAVLNTIVPAGNLKSHLQVVVNHLASLGVTLDPGQLNGPDITSDQGYPWQNGEDVLNYLHKLTGWLWGLDGDLVASMWEIGSRVAPTAFSTAAGNIDGGLEWEEENLDYRNGQWITFGGSAPDDTEKLDRFEGNGTNRIFTPNYWVRTKPIYVYHEPTDSNLPIGVKGVDTHLEWVWDEANFRLEQLDEAPAGVFHDPLDPGDFIEITYGVLFPMSVYVQDDVEVADKGPYIRVETADAITDIDAARTYGLARIRQSIVTPKRVTLPTREVGNRPGMVCSVTVAEQDMSGSHLIESEVITYSPLPGHDFGDGGGNYELSVRLGLVSGAERPENVMDWWKDRLTVGGGVAAGSASVGGSETGATIAGAGRVYADLGGSRTGVVSGATLTQLAPEARKVYLDPAWFVGGAATVRVELQTLNAGTSVKAQLRRLDIDAVVAESDTMTSTTMTAMPAFNAVLPVAGLYALYLVRSNSSASARGIGSLHG